MADERELRVIEALDEAWRATSEIASAARLSRHAALVVLRGLLREHWVQIGRGSHQVGQPPQLRYTYVWRRVPPSIGYPYSGGAFSSTTVSVNTPPTHGSGLTSTLTATPLPRADHA